MVESISSKCDCWDGWTELSCDSGRTHSNHRSTIWGRKKLTLEKENDL